MFFFIYLLYKCHIYIYIEKIKSKNVNLIKKIKKLYTFNYSIKKKLLKNTKKYAYYIHYIVKKSSN